MVENMMKLHKCENAAFAAGGRQSPVRSPLASIVGTRPGGLAGRSTKPNCAAAPREQCNLLP